MDSIKYLLSIETRGIKFGIQRTRKIMECCGNPQLGLPVIQVVGTNGKGSVSAMISNILKSSGYKTGLFTSPHLVRVNERIRVNSIPILDAEIEMFIQRYKSTIENIESTFFETITAMACWYFKKKHVDIAVMETGLGGRLDSVSICESIATVITPISYDHLEILGETLSEIAFEKAGAMKKNVVCISAHQKSAVKKVLLKEALNIGNPIHFLNGTKKLKYEVNIPGKIQKENAMFAVSSLNLLPKFSISEEAIRQGLQTVHWFGRNQMVQKNPKVIFDVAHNVESLRSFLEYYKSLNILGDSVLIIALNARKRIQSLVALIQSMFLYIICTETGNQYSMDAEMLRTHFHDEHHAEIIKNPEAAVRLGLKNLSTRGGMAIVGSHYLGPAVSSVFKISFDKF